MNQDTEFRVLSAESRALIGRKVKVNDNGRAGTIRDICPDPMGRPYSAVVTSEDEPKTAILALDEVTFTDQQN